MDLAVDETSAVRTAQLVAPIIDRLRMAIAAGVQRHPRAAVILLRLGLQREGIQIFVLLRNMLPARTVRVDDVRATVRYEPAARVDSGLTSLSEAGLVGLGSDSLTLTPAGRDAMAELIDVSEAVVTDLWHGHHAETPRLTELADRALRAALAVPGPALTVVAPPYDSPASTASTRLAERLTGLRFHRADSHAAAWMAAGLSAQHIQQLAPGPQKDAIEDDTNQRAAVAYAALSPDERREFVAGLAALPG